MQALAGFRRFPTWMWRNADVLDFVGWLREHNDGRAPEARAGFYGLDLYSLHASIAEVVRYLDGRRPGGRRARPAALRLLRSLRRRQRSLRPRRCSRACAESCEDEVVAQLVELQRRAASAAGSDGPQADDAASTPSRTPASPRTPSGTTATMFRGRISSWNLRDTHMAETLDALLEHLDAPRAGEPRVVVWAHNSHLGDAARHRDGGGASSTSASWCASATGESLLVGFTTYGGTVTAASRLGRAGRAQAGDARRCPAATRRCSTAPASAACCWTCAATAPASRWLREPRLERAIGVIYRPETERQSHYFHARLADQFDFVLHLDHTRAVEPLETVPPPSDEIPETFPTGV